MFKIVQILLTVVVTLQGIGMYMMWKCITGLAGNVSGIVENVGIISDILEILCRVGDLNKANGKISGEPIALALESC